MTHLLVKIAAAFRQRSSPLVQWKRRHLPTQHNDDDGNVWNVEGVVSQSCKLDPRGGTMAASCEAVIGGRSASDLVGRLVSFK
jgi:hypothetical protein